MILLAQVLAVLDLAILALVVVNVLTWPRLRPAGGDPRPESASLSRWPGGSAGTYTPTPAEASSAAAPVHRSGRRVTVSGEGSLESVSGPRSEDLDVEGGGDVERRGPGALAGGLCDGAGQAPLEIDAGKAPSQRRSGPPAGSPLSPLRPPAEPPGSREELDVSGRGRATLPGAVSVLIPARNEEANLDPCLDAVLAQGPVVGEVLVYDDASTDGTAERVRRRAGRDDRVRLLSGGPLPAGWCGKPHACARLAEAARREWLLFLDADARLAPGGVDGLVAEARRRQATLLSAWPGLAMESRAEKLLMPMLNFFVLTLYPAALQLVRREPALGLAHGACLLARRTDYAELGGHARVRDEIFEDTRLARLWRESGRRGLCLDGQEVVRVRMYASAGEIWRGFRKNLHAGFRRQASFWAFLLFHAGLFLAPFLLAPALSLTGETAAAAWAGTAAGAVVAMRLALGLRFGHPPGSAWLHPLAEGFLLALGVASWWGARRGGGVEWKGRRYRVGEGEVGRG